MWCRTMRLTRSTSSSTWRPRSFSQPGPHHRETLATSSRWPYRCSMCLRLWNFSNRRESIVVWALASWPYHACMLPWSMTPVCEVGTILTKPLCTSRLRRESWSMSSISKRSLRDWTRVSHPTSTTCEVALSRSSRISFCKPIASTLTASSTRISSFFTKTFYIAWRRLRKWVGVIRISQSHQVS